MVETSYIHTEDIFYNKIQCYFNVMLRSNGSCSLQKSHEMSFLTQRL